MDELKTIIKQAIDMHVHIGPEVISRRYTAGSLAQTEAGKLGGAVLKNHFYPTSPQCVSARNFSEYGAIVLNWSVGGLNPEAVRSASLLSKQKIVVWLPTIHSQQFLANSEYEIPPEWCAGTSLETRRAQEVEGIFLLTRRGNLTRQAKAVIDAVAEVGAVLATGHISIAESVAVCSYALKIGVSGIVVTHPIYQRIAMPLARQRALAAQGCFMEVCYSMYLIDGIPIQKIVKEIRAVGPDSIVMSSDMGQLQSPPPSAGLLNFSRLLIKEGIPVEWIQKMLVTNPKRILERS